VIKRDSITLSRACGGACTATLMSGFVQPLALIRNLGRLNPQYALNLLKILLFYILFAVVSLFSGVYAHAEDSDQTVEAAAVKEVESLNKALVADLAPEIRVVLEGEELPTTQVSKDGDGGVYVRAEPIFEALNDEYEYNIDEGVLVVHRSQDGVVMELYTDTGIVKANGKALGKLRDFGEVRVGMINLTPNAIAVLSGAIGKMDEESKVINFELDPRLKVATGFEIFVNEIPLGQIDPGFRVATTLTTDRKRAWPRSVFVGRRIFCASSSFPRWCVVPAQSRYWLS